MCVACYRQKSNMHACREPTVGFKKRLPRSRISPPLLVLPIEQMIIMETINGYQPGPGSAGSKYAGSATPLPPIIAYQNRYKLPAIPYNGSIGPYIDIDVDDYPNEAWAKHQLGEEDLMWTATMNTTERFGNRINEVINTQVGITHYFWTSGTRLVDLLFYKAEPEEFLKAYLAKYPSSL